MRIGLLCAPVRDNRITRGEWLDLGGKSFAAQSEIAALMLSTNHEIMIVDPEREYGKLVEAMHGVVFQITAGGSHRLNALDLSRGYEAGENPVVLKSEFVLSLCEQVIGAGKLGPLKNPH